MTDGEADLLADTGAVVVAHDRLDHASNCVRDLLRRLPARHVVLVLNAPDDVDPLVLAELQEIVAVVVPSAPQGYGANLNLGVQSLPPELTFAILANDDVHFRAHGIARLVAHLREDSRVGLAGPTLQNADGAPVSSSDVFPTALGAIILSGVPARPAAPLKRIHVRQRALAQSRREAETAPARTRPVDWVVGAAMAVRLEAFREIGGFDEDFFLYSEETDLCYRLWDKGWKVITSSDVSVVHVHGQSTRTSGDRYHRMLNEGRRRYLLKRLGRLRWAMLQPLMVGAFATTSASHLVGGAFRPQTLSQRLARVRSRWYTRMFLRAGSSSSSSVGTGAAISGRGSRARA